MKGTNKEETGKGGGGKIALVPHASSASCLGVISNAAEAKASGGRGGRYSGDLTRVSQKTSAALFFFFFLGGRQTQDVDHDESQVSEKDKEHKTEVVQQLTTCRFSAALNGLVVLQLAAVDHPELDDTSLQSQRGQSKVETHKH